MDTKYFRGDGRSALPSFKKPDPVASVVYDTPTAGPKMTWNADGLHIEDPRLMDRPVTFGGLKGCYTIGWETIDRMRARFAPAKES